MRAGGRAEAATSFVGGVRNASRASGRPGESSLGRDRDQCDGGRSVWLWDRPMWDAAFVATWPGTTVETQGVGRWCGVCAGLFEAITERRMKEALFQLSFNLREDDVEDRDGLLARGDLNRSQTGRTKVEIRTLANSSWFVQQIAFGLPQTPSRQRLDFEVAKGKSSRKGWPSGVPNAITELLVAEMWMVLGSGAYRVTGSIIPNPGTPG